MGPLHSQIDLEQLETLISLDKGSPGLLRNILLAFFDIVPKEIVALRALADGHDRGELALAAHRFKSSCLNLGANYVSDALWDLESQAKHLPATEILVLVEKIERLSALALSELAPHLQDVPG